MSITDMTDGWATGYQSTRHTVTSSPTTAKLLNVTNARSKVWSTRHNAVRHDGQLITPFYGVTS